MSLTLLVGGARSGKSALALDLARSSGSPVTFIATATAGDDDMSRRIGRHRDERPADWQTIEEAVDLCAAIAAADPDDTIVVDCLTLWVSNVMLAGAPADIDAVVDVLTARSGSSIVVTNEVGMGVVPPTDLGREYRDLLGRVNRAVSLAADRCLLVVAGRLLELSRPEDL